MTEPVRFLLGRGPVAVALVAAMLLAAGAYFGYAAYADLAEPIALGESLVLDRQAGWWLFVALAAGGVLAGLFLLLRTLRNLGGDQSVLLDANRIVMTGFDASGEDKVLFYADIVNVVESRLRGIPMIEITGRDGTRIAVGSVMLRDPDQFERFRMELLSRIPPTLTAAPRAPAL